MRIISKKTLREFWKRHPDAEAPLVAWCKEVEKEDWDTLTSVTQRYPRSSTVGDNRAVFRIKGNRYRMVVWINYRRRAVYVKWLGTHAEYNRIDAKTVGLANDQANTIR